MKSRPKVGTTGELKFTVAQEHVIDFATDGMPAVLSTPRLIGLLERTAREAMYPFLDANERTVGAEIEIRHLAPTPLVRERHLPCARNRVRRREHHLSRRSA
ncbi:MAG: hypothetical protein V9G29_16105 [Burkholderiaceae bacterium]